MLRHFVLHGNRLLWFRRVTDREPRGGIILGRGTEITRTYMGVGEEPQEDLCISIRDLSSSSSSSSRSNSSLNNLPSTTKTATGGGRGGVFRAPFSLALRCQSGREAAD